MPVHAFFDAYVEVDGGRLAEFDVETDMNDEGVPRATCWIPSEAGKVFKACCIDQRPSPRGATMHRFTLDGAYIAKRYIRSDYGPFQAKAGYPALARLDDVSVEGGRRPILFTNLELTDDDAALSVGVSASLGEICLQIRPIIITGYDDKKSRPKNVSLMAGTIHERSKKAGAHSVQLGPLVVHESRGKRAVWANDGPQLAMFVFRYRPLPLLQAQGIAPPSAPAQSERSPTPEAANVQPKEEVMDEHNESDDDEERRLQAQIAESQARLASIQKRKRSDNGTRVKAEPSSRRPRFSGPSEVIDLTIE